jgi:pentatricopeptide repeat protein
VKPNKITFVRLLKACSVPEALDDGKRIHKHASRRNLETNMYVGAALMEMYIKCGSIKEARKVFLGIFPKDSSVWSLMLSGYVQNGLFHETLKAFQHMRWKYGIQPTPTLWITALNACGNIADLEYGKLLHACINESYYELDGCVMNELVQMYIKCGSLPDACALFERCLAPPASLWISLISACKEAGNNEQASKLLFQLEQSGVSSMQPSSPYNAYVDSIQCKGVLQPSGEVQKLASDTVQTCLPLATTKHSLYPERSMMH